MIRLQRRSASELVPLNGIAADALQLSSGALRAVLECSTLAFAIKGEAEQRALVDGWASLLNSLSHPLQIVIRSRQLDPAGLAPLPANVDPNQALLRDSYRRLLEELAGRRRILDRRFYIVVPWDGIAGHRGPKAGDGPDMLEQRARWVAECLRRLDLEPRRLRDHELADLLRRTLDPAAASQPLALDDCLTDSRDLVAPAAFAEGPSSVSVSELVARTIAVSRYPGRLHPCWLGDLQSFEGDLDLALHVHP
ncbi:MAG: hypothetical protein ACREEC_07130, partial [Thermoplasmata archaeon]